MENKISNTEYENPFKFLDAFKTKDRQYFYGREKEETSLLAAFKKSSLVILYGPSGSGKSSLINCGLIPNVRLNRNILIRRNKNIIQSIEEKLFTNKSKKNNIDFSKLIKSIDSINLQINSYKQTINNANKSVIDLKTAKQKGLIKKEKVEEGVKVLFEKKEAANKMLLEAYKKEKEINKQLNVIINKLLSTELKGITYLVFDQFEEVFTTNQENNEEIRQFGTFLSFILSSNIPIKILLAVREEYFGRLTTLDKFLPQVLYRNSFIDNPTIATAEKIIRKSFDAFNINKWVDKKDLNLLDKEEDALDKQEKNNRIKLILEQLTKTEGTNNLSKNRIYLPFLQIYLYKLYEVDFIRTYVTENKFIPEEYKKFPPLEFEKTEILKFGNIDKILKEYITEINNELSEKFKEKNAYTIIRFLKNFATIENTKKRVEIIVDENTPNLIRISDTNINKEIQKNTWGDTSRKYTGKISAFIKKLEKYRLLKIDKDHVELSHDSLARLINRFPIEKSIKEIYREEFEGMFNARKIAGQYLNNNQVRRFEEENYIDFILRGQEKEIGEQKNKFWKDSKERVQRKKKIKTLAITAAIISLICLTGFFFYQNTALKNTINELNTAQKNLKDSNTKNESTSNIYQNAGKAFNNLRSDPTSAFNEINYADTVGYFFDKPKPQLIGDFKNELYGGFHKFPFYSKNIILPGKNEITQVKHIISKTNPDSVYIYALDKQKDLFEIKINLSNKNQPNIDTIGEKVDLFEPYYQNSLISLIFTKKDTAFKKLASYEKIFPLNIIKADKINLTNANVLTHIKDNKFITNSGSNILEMELVNNSLKKKAIKSTYSSFNIRKIEGLEESEQYYFINDTYKGDGKFFKSKFSSKNSKYITTESNFIDFDFMNDNKFIAVKGDTLKEIFTYEINKNEDGERAHSIIENHEGKITSIACFQKNDGQELQELILLGSSDRTTSFWKNFKLTKRLVGHTDAISDVAFINERYGMTASKDGSIKIWDLNPIEKNSMQIKEARSIEKLKHSPFDSTLLVGFEYNGNPKKNGGYLLAICNDLDPKSEDCQQKRKQYRTRHDPVIGNITSFDFNSEGQLLIGGFTNHLIASIVDSTIFRYANHFSTIFDLEIHNNNLAVATQKGLLFFENYPEKKEALTENKKENYDAVLRQITFNSVDIFDRLVVGAADNDNIYLWNVDNQHIDTLSQHIDKVTSINFSKSGTYFISGSQDNKAIIWKKNDQNNSYSKFQTLEDHTSDILDVEFYGDSLLVTASKDNTAQIYRLKNPYFIKQSSLIRHDGAINEATFSADGKYIFTGDNKGIIKKWAFGKFEEDVKARIQTK